LLCALITLGREISGTWTLSICLIEVSRIFDKSQKPSRTVDPKLEAGQLKEAIQLGVIYGNLSGNDGFR